MDSAVAEVGAGPSPGARGDAEMMAVLPCTTPGHQALLPSPSRTSSSSAWDKTNPAVLQAHWATIYV